MARFLTFALVAPIASFGALAVGERRDGWSRPARSAVLGLIGGCLGLAREDAEAQVALGQGYGLALLCDTPGRLLADFHTAQIGRPARGQVFRTRAQELAAEKVDTVLSRRDYRVSAWHLAALWAREEVSPRWSLDALAEAMARPVFTPYLGRRACPLGLPLAPRLTDAASPSEALAARSTDGPEARFRWSLADAEQAPFVARDPWPGDGDARATRRIEERRDEPLSRTLWQFGLRSEVIEAFPPSGGKP